MMLNPDASPFFAPGNEGRLLRAPAAQWKHQLKTPMRNDQRNQSPRLEAENNQKLVQENAKLKEEIALLKRERERNPGQARIEERLGSAGSSGHFQNLAITRR